MEVDVRYCDLHSATFIKLLPIEMEIIVVAQLSIRIAFCGMVE
jgi:hypothetical protein